MTDSEIKNVAFEAIKSVFGGGLSEENVVIDFYAEDVTREEFNSIRKRFIEENCFQDTEEALMDADGEVFFSGADSDKAGVLVRRFDDDGLTLHSLPHELCHIFCFYH